MKKIILVLILAMPLTLLACHFTDMATVMGNAAKVDSVPASQKCLSQSDAEKILGQHALLKERTAETKTGKSEYKCTWTATEADPKTNMTGNVYYMLEEYNNTIAAVNAYTNIVESNKNMPGLTILKGIGDEALLHTDEKNFAMIICRKRNQVLRIKINKLTSFTSKEELMRVVKEIM